MWCTDVLFNRMTHSPGELRDRQRDGEKERDRKIPLTRSFMQKRKSETGSGNKSSVRCKWIIEVSQPLRLKKDDPFTTPTSKNDVAGRETSVDSGQLLEIIFDEISSCDVC